MSIRGLIHKMGILSDGRNIEIYDGTITARNLAVNFGQDWYVDYATGADTNSGRSWARALKTYSAAIAKAVTNRNDRIWIHGNSTVVETSMVTLSKSRIHTIGVDGAPTLFGYGAGAKISLTATTGATNIATFKNTGVRNTFANIKFINSSTVAEGLYSVVEAGEYARYKNCEFCKDTDLDVTGAAELVCNGDSAQFQRCTIGSLANAITGAIIRPCVLLTKGIVAGAVSRDVVFDECLFWRSCGNTANRFVYGANADDVERMMLFNACQFWNSKIAAAVPAQNVAFGSTLTVGEVLLNRCTSMNAATAMSTTTGVFVDGPTPTGAGATIGIAIQAS